jgi:XTP/dITP diphosphohydrolase
MDTYLIATRNGHKVSEISAVLAPAVRCLGLAGFRDVPDVVEDASSFRGNAALKARSLARWITGKGAAQAAKLAGPGPLWVLADDSGLEVDALRGAPGVHSARFAALDQPGMRGNSPDADNNAKLLRLLDDTPEPARTARFRCVLALLPSAGGEAMFFEGTCEGHIAFRPSGSAGFGYDPLFVPDGQRASFAELGADVKNRISHRAQALAALKAHLGRK